MQKLGSGVTILQLDIQSQTPLITLLYSNEFIKILIYKTTKVNVKVKVKLSLRLPKHHAMKTYWGSGGIAPRIFDLGTRWR
jgi:hypothetical protein